MAEASDLADILAVIRSLPTDSNPYDAFANTIRQSVFPNCPAWLFVQLKINSALYAVMTVFTLAALIGIYSTGSLWLFRLRQTPKGALILPNSTVLYCLWATCFLVLMQAGIWLTLNVYKHDRHADTLVALNGPQFMPLEFAYWFETWGMAAAAYLSAPFTSRFKWIASIPAWVLNLYFVGIPIAYLASCQTIFAVSAVDFGRAYTPFHDLMSTLSAGAAGWVPGSPFVLQPGILDQLAALSSGMSAYISHATTGYTVFLGFLIQATFSFGPFGYLHISMLGSQVAAGRARQGRLTATSEVSHVSQSQQEASAIRLERVYGLMALETGCLALSALLYTCLAGAMAFHFEALTTTGLGVAVSNTLSLYIYSVLGMVINCMIVWRVWQPIIVSSRRTPTSSASSRTRFPSHGISVITKTEQHVDTGLVELPLHKNYRKASMTARYALSHPPTQMADSASYSEEEKAASPYTFTLQYEHPLPPTPATIESGRRSPSSVGGSTH